MNGCRKIAAFDLLIDCASPEADLVLDFSKAKQPAGGCRGVTLVVFHVSLRVRTIAHTN
jgi:hypothetical protein